MAFGFRLQQGLGLGGAEVAAGRRDPNPYPNPDPTLQPNPNPAPNPSPSPNPTPSQDAMVFLQPAAVMSCAAIVGMAFFSDVRRLEEIGGDRGRLGAILGTAFFSDVG